MRKDCCQIMRLCLGIPFIGHYFVEGTASFGRGTKKLDAQAVLQASVYIKFSRCFTLEL